MRISAIAILVALFLWPAAMFGQSPELMDAYNRANELSAEGRYQEAIPFAKEALHLSEREFGPVHQNTGITLNNLALLKATTPRRSRSTSARWRSMRKHSASIILTWPRAWMAAEDDVLYPYLGRSKEMPPSAKAVKLTGANFEPEFDADGIVAAINDFLT